MALVAAACLPLAGCGDWRPFGPRAAPPSEAVTVETALAATPRPEARPGPVAALGAGGRTAAALDTTTPAERAAAVALPAAPARDLGRTIASLGAPGEPGFWLLTPLVAELRPGRVTAASGATVRVELRPSGTAPGSGSQLSLAAFRALGLGLTDLPELVVALE